jgi:hypothetical protein
MKEELWDWTLYKVDFWVTTAYDNPKVPLEVYQRLMKRVYYSEN